MAVENPLDAFLKPQSVAVIGATERPGAWGSFIMEGLLSRNYPGRIYPINRNAGQVYGIPAYKDILDVNGAIDLAVLTIPAKFAEEAIDLCGRKGVRGVTIITADFGEAYAGGKEKEKTLVQLARRYGMRLLGPNISGTFNLHAEFNASGGPGRFVQPTGLAAICQGGYAFYEMLAAASNRRMGVGKFIHTGNEADLTVTDFLEHFGPDPEVEGIMMYLETIRDGRRFLETARQVSRVKPVVVYKAGRTPGSARAALSHTGALSGVKEIYNGLLLQAGLTISPTMELLLPLSHALIERPPLRGPRVAIVTMGGSWGVSLSDALEEAGLEVVELSAPLQKTLRDMGMPRRASTRNPVDIGASGLFFEKDTLVGFGREVLASGEVDALILHGVGRPGLVPPEATEERKMFLEINKQVIKDYAALETEMGRPVLIGSHFTPWESQEVHDLNQEGFRIYQRLSELAQILTLMHNYWRRRLGDPAR